MVKSGEEDLYDRVRQQRTLEPGAEVTLAYAHEIAEDEGYEDLKEEVEEKELVTRGSAFDLKSFGVTVGSGLTAEYGYRFLTEDYDPLGEVGVAASRYVSEIGGLVPEEHNVTGLLIFFGVGYAALKLIQRREIEQELDLEDLKEGLDPGDLQHLSSEHMEMLEELEKEYGVDMYPGPREHKDTSLMGLQDER